jgi:HD-GYP domain-containing protein (c-di-GMP phosphodiesterase class II)
MSEVSALARKAEAEAEAARVQQMQILGADLVLKLSQLLRTARLHALNNKALDRPLEGTLETMNRVLSGHEEVILLGENYTVQVNGVRVRMRRGLVEQAELLTRYLRSRGVGGLLVNQVTTAADWRTVLTVLQAAPEVQADEHLDDDAWSVQLNAELVQADVKHIKFAAPLRLKVAHLGAMGGEGESVRVAADRPLYVYIRSLRAVQALYLRVQHNRPHLGLARVVQQLVEVEGEMPRYWQKLLYLKGGPSYEVRHPVNVAVLSIALGKRLGLNRSALLDLGVSALVADAGMALVPEGIRNKAGKLSADERLLLEHHPVDSARVVLESTRMDPAGCRRVRAAFEHQLGWNGSGYPHVLTQRPQHLFARIYAIAELYDALTSTTAWRKGMYPEAALAKLIELRGQQLDPTLVLHFVNLLGRIPLASPLRLDTGEIARVHAPPRDPDFLQRPVVKVIYGADREKLDEPVLVDLMDQDDQGNYTRSIVEVLPRRLKEKTAQG